MLKRTIFALAALLVMVVAAEAQTSKKDWAKFYRYEEANKTLAQAPDVVFMGNSITDNWAKFRPEFFADHNFAGRGISGQTTSQMLVRFRADVIALHPKKVVILAGTNDIALNNGPITLPHILENIISMCELAEHNGIGVVLCSVLPCKAYKWRPEVEPAPIIKQLNAMIKEYATAKGYPYVDYHSALTDEEGGLPAKWSPDGCHPNVEGYLIMEDLLLKTLNR